jgi:PPOX class probable F420-dependent enzyme
MSLPIPEKFHDLFSRPLLCALTTVNPDGQPHSVPVWCDFDGEHVRINVPAATKKARNLQVNPKLSLLVIDPQNGGHWIEIQGKVGELKDRHCLQLRERLKALVEVPWGYGCWADHFHSSAQFYELPAYRVCAAPDHRRQ